MGPVRAVDPEIERLERTLAPLRYRHRANLLRSRHAPAGRWWAMAAAAAVLAAAVGLVRQTPAPPATGWEVESVHGSASLGSRKAAVAMSLRAGQTVRTARDTEIGFRAEEFGTMLVGPDSELHATAGRRLELERGLLHAYIWAPPRQFVVDTPSARAVDLGCQYTIAVGRLGRRPAARFAGMGRVPKWRPGGLHPARCGLRDAEAEGAGHPLL
ncbi:MAG: hypothetical protein WDO73_15130 [Ignavibacteriota bacterium]